MGRKYDVQIKFEFERLKSLRFMLILMDDQTEQVPEVMSISAPIVFKLKVYRITLSENKHFADINKSLYHKQ